MNPTETALVMGLAGMATAVALDFFTIPAAVLHSSVSQAFLLIMALVLFAYSPVVGIAAIALFAIVMFKRNVQKTAQYYDAAYEMSRQNAINQMYNEQPVQEQPAFVTQPREYVVIYKDRESSSQHSSSSQSPSQSPSQPSPSPSPSVDSVTPLDGEDDGFANPNQIGSYPLGDRRPTAAANQSFTAMYRPTEDMGDNTFERMGPNMDQKMHAFAY